LGRSSRCINLLDDYEEGTWTPTLNANLTIDSSYDDWSYTKIGRQVTIRGLFKCSAVSGTNSITVGLPFVAGNFGGSANDSGVCNMFTTIDHGKAGVASYIYSGADHMRFYGLGEEDAGWNRINNSDIDTSSQIYVVHTYFT